jgi:hypothetical protein
MRNAKKNPGGGGLASVKLSGRVGAVQVKGNLGLGVIPQKKVQYFLKFYDYQWPQQYTGYIRIRNYLASQIRNLGIHSYPSERNTVSTLFADPENRFQHDY